MVHCSVLGDLGPVQDLGTVVAVLVLVKVVGTQENVTAGMCALFVESHAEGLMTDLVHFGHDELAVLALEIPLFQDFLLIALLVAVLIVFHA